MRPRVTQTQRSILRAIAESQRVLGIPPTIRELCKAVGMRSTNGVAEQLAVLEQKGLVRRTPALSRCLFLTPGGKAAANAPLVRPALREGEA